MRVQLRAVVELYRRMRRRDRQVSRILRHAAAKEWYALLRIRRRARPAELRAAYRKLAKRVHPDKTRDDRASRAFDTLRDAHDLLSDEKARKRYDAELAREDLERRQRRERRMRAAGIR